MGKSRKKRTRRKAARKGAGTSRSTTNVGEDEAAAQGTEAAERLVKEPDRAGEDGDVASPSLPKGSPPERILLRAEAGDEAVPRQEAKPTTGRMVDDLMSIPPFRERVLALLMEKLR